MLPGSAREVRLEIVDGKPAYEVLVLPTNGDTCVRVEVDAASGKVLTSGKEKDDEDDDD